MKNLINIVLIYIAVVLQISLMPAISFYQGMPNIILLVATSLAMINRREEALWWIILGGILLDIISAGYFGIYTLSFLAIYFMTYFLVKKIFTEPSIYLSIPIFFVCSIIVDIPWMVIDSQWQIMLADAIYNTIVGCVIYFFIRYYYKPTEQIKV